MATLFAVLTWILPLWAGVTPAAAKPEVTNLVTGSLVPPSLVVDGRARPHERLQVVVEFPTSKLPGYASYRDVIARREVVADDRGQYRARLDLHRLPDPSPVVLSVAPPGQLPVSRLELTVEQQRTRPSIPPQ